MDEWKTEVAKSNMISPPGGCTDEYFSSDGFFPYYFSQKIKILFIARENRDLADIDGCTYIEYLFDWFKTSKLGNSGRLHYWMLKIAYGILNDGGNIPYDKVPEPYKIIKDFATNNGISYALVNLSKYAGKAASSDVKLISSFLEHSNLEKCDFFQKEFSILSPNLIIIMNPWRFAQLRPHLRLVFKGISELQKENTCFITEINGRHVPVINMCHFTARANVYKLAMELYKKSFAGK